LPVQSTFFSYSSLNSLPDNNTYANFELDSLFPSTKSSSQAIDFNNINAGIAANLHCLNENDSSTQINNDNYRNDNKTLRLVEDVNGFNFSSNKSNNFDPSSSFHDIDDLNEFDQLNPFVGDFNGLNISSEEFNLVEGLDFSTSSPSLLDNNSFAIKSCEEFNLNSPTEMLSFVNVKENGTKNINNTIYSSLLDKN
jgi:hypothetical protein